GLNTGNVGEEGFVAREKTPDKDAKGTTTADGVSVRVARGPSEQQAKRQNCHKSKRSHNLENIGLHNSAIRVKPRKEKRTPFGFSNPLRLLSHGDENVPEKAIRELVANALIHQDFSVTGA